MNQVDKPVLIEVVNVKKSFKKADRQEVPVLDNLDLNLYDGEIVALLGKSGSGKSTLLRIIGGLVKPTSGQVLHHYALPGRFCP